jgi:hypothetical protein
MEKTTFNFNVRSKAYEEKLAPEQRAFLIKNKQETNEKLVNLDKDHHANKRQRIEDTEKIRAQHYKDQLNMRRPPNTPPPRIPSRAEIKAEAEYLVQRGYITSRQKIIREGRQKETEYIEKSLGIERSSRAEPSHDINNDRGHDR